MRGRIRRIRSRENSIPTPKRSRATPMSARFSMVLERETQPNPPGPARRPATR
jgi:hypothetical protein